MAQNSTGAASQNGTGRGPLDVAAIRRDFPILQRQVHDKPLVYLDNAATSQKPRQVIQALVDYYEQTNANIHRASTRWPKRRPRRTRAPVRRRRSSSARTVPTRSCSPATPPSR